jgi:hypothetical protein
MKSISLVLAVVVLNVVAAGAWSAYHSKILTRQTDRHYLQQLGYEQVERETLSAAEEF